VDQPTRAALRRETLRCASPDTLHDLQFVGAGVTLNYGSGSVPPNFPSPFQVAISNINVKLQSHGLTPDQAVQLMRDAVTVYCPDASG
jgi:hypothetical protein